LTHTREIKADFSDARIRVGEIFQVSGALP